jgi:hypothetical protein
MRGSAMGGAFVALAIVATCVAGGAARSQTPPGTDIVADVRAAMSSGGWIKGHEALGAFPVRSWRHPRCARCAVVGGAWRASGRTARQSHSILG